MEIVRKILSNRFTAFIIIFFALVVCSILFFRPYILLTVGSDEACDLTVYYDNGAKEGYCFDDAHMTQTQLISGGEQTVKVLVPRSGLNRLRLDFGNMPCHVAISQMVIVPNCIQSYRYSAEEAFQAFPVLNDIAQSSCEDGAAKYTISGSDGFIAAQASLTDGKRCEYNVQWKDAVLLFLLSLLLSFTDVAIQIARDPARRLHSQYQKQRDALARFIGDHHKFLLFEVTVTVILVVCFGYIHIRGVKYVYIDIGADTYCSYMPIYLLYQNILRAGGGLWSFSKGLGHSVVDGGQFVDPFSSILLLFPQERIADGILLVTVVKFYTVSVLAYHYLKKIGFSENAVVFGALAYTFCGFFVSWGQHYLFATAFVYLTLCLYSFELWAHDKKGTLLVLSVAGLVLFSTYFAYIILLFLAIYVVFRYFALYHFEIKHFLQYGFSLLGYVLLGIGISAAVFFPAIYQLAHSARVTGAQGLPTQLATPLFYLCACLRLFSDSILGINDYFGAPGYFAGKQQLNFYEMPFLYTSILFVILLPMLFKKKVCGKVAKTAMVSVFLSVVFIGVSGSVFNGFSTIASRWTMVLMPLFSMGICRGIEALSDNVSLNCRYCLVSAAISGIFLLAVNIFSKQLFGQELSQESKIHLFIPLLVVLLYLIAFAVSGLKRKGSASIMLILLVILTIDLGTNAFMSIDWKRNLMDDPEGIYFDGTQEALDWIERNDTDFYRIEKSYRKIDLSDPLAQGYRGEKNYSGIYSSSFNNYKSSFDLRYQDSNYFYGFDDKQTLRNLAAGKYYLTRTPSERSGYVFMEQVGDIYVYQNQNALPLAYLQDQVFDPSELLDYGLQQRQNTLYAGFLSEEEPLLVKYQRNPSAKETVAYTDVKFSRVLNEQGDCTGIILDAPNTKTLVVRFRFEKGAFRHGQIFCQPITIYGQEGIIHQQETFFISRVDVDRNAELEAEISMLGVSQIDWSSYGSVLPIDVVVMEKDDEQVSTLCRELQQGGMKIQSLTDSHIVGHIEADKPGMLVTSIPFDKGWSVFVDGAKAELHMVNLAFIGVELTEGAHTVEFRYLPYGMQIGRMVSITSIAIFLTLLMRKRRKNCVPQSRQ